MDLIRRYGVYLAVVILVVIGLIFFLIKDNVGSDQDAREKARQERMASNSDPTQGDDSSGSGSDGSGGVPDDGATPEYILEKYLEWAEYPPFSRPMSILNHDLAFPFIIETSPDYSIDPKTNEATGYVCLFQPKTWAVIGNKDMMYVTLECRDKARNRVKVSIDSHQVFKEWEGQRYGVVSASVNDNGTDGDQTRGDNIFTFSWKPQKADWGQMSLVAEITYGPENLKTTLTSSFFSSPSIPAEFNGVFSDSLQDGSLIVRAVVNVYRKGKYHLEANLKDEKNGEYIAYAVYDGDLVSGSNEVEFTFFGKILRDKDLDGPYLATSFRGHRVNLPIDPEWFNQGAEGLRKIQAAKTTEPDRELVVPYKDEYKTKYYKVESFSNAAWDSADKQNRIRQIKALQ
ncbi:hypothetical protein EHR01_18990 [Leptospira mtsangambouensis]|uniref:Carbohydrate-binding domain-containing protein n=1 Tax=Leptospira mtsangambouensis TaxID=2484912 RepID=A0ABY2NXW0_9LEPT|nr:hypothetical protein [Leptospira mtsangambouensis]MCG6139584.1 hypothetical protein [Leptospira mtsangambouensis]TGM73281.1 hypothetical protein EHR01_18990 [Leptospira mtsangambouensis]